MIVKTQCERKFIVKELPNLDDFKIEKIEQWYKTKPGKSESIRLRKYEDGRCYMDIVRGLGKIRTKYGTKIEWEKFKNKDLSKLYFIKKTRYKKRFDNILMCIDIFENGLHIVEIETYGEEEYIDNFEIPNWFGEEVTDNIKFTNNWLAYETHIF